MRITFFGTPDYVLPIVDSLHKEFLHLGKSPIVAVVTQKPKPQGRKRIITYSPVDRWAHEHKVPVFYSSYDFLKEKIGADVGILVAYGKIIPREVISSFPHGILNVHPSLLPRWRGASPVQAAIVSGQVQTGVSIIKMDEKVDHGPIISQFREDIELSDTTGSLGARLFERASQVLVQLLKPYVSGKITPRKQNHKQATFTTLISKDHGFIPPQFLNAALTRTDLVRRRWKIPFIKNYSLSLSASCLGRFIRAMDPWPGAWTQIKILKDKDTKILRLKILKAHVEQPVPSAYSLVPDLVQLEGKNPVSWKQFKEAYPDSSFS